MRSRSILLLSAVFLLLLMGTYSNSFVVSNSSNETLPLMHVDNTSVAGYTVHAPISITSDADFETQSWPGNGTLNDPYIISGLNITSTSVCIDIRNTRAHFKVMNCILSSPTASGNEGLYLDNVTYGVVRDCIIDSHIQGLYLRDVVDCSFVNNTASSNGQVGFIFYFADKCTLVNNTVIDGTETGFHFGDSGNCTLINNTATGFRRGFNLYTTTNCSLIDNTAKDNVQWGFLIDTNSHNTTMTNNMAINSNNGFALDNADNCTLNENTAEDNSFAGYILSFSHNNTLFDNTVTGSSTGIKLHICYDNTIYGNTIISNGANAEDEGGVDNLWDDDVSIGNIWDDYDGSGTYTIPGSAGSVDHYPLLYDLVIPSIDNPNDVSYTEGTTDNSITWTPADANPSSYVVYKDESVLVSSSWDGSQVIVNVDNLAVGSYNYTLEVIDLGGNIAVDSVTVTVTVATTTTTTPTPTFPDGSGMMMLVIGVGGAAVVIVIVLIVLKKRGG